DARRPVQADGPAVVAEPLPRNDHLCSRSTGQRLDGRPALEPRLPARDDAIDLRLLQHHLADEDGVRVAGVAPGQIATVRLEPGQELLLHGWSLEPAGADAPVRSLREGNAPFSRSVRACRKRKR